MMNLSVSLRNPGLGISEDFLLFPKKPDRRWLRLDRLIAGWSNLIQQGASQTNQSKHVCSLRKEEQILVSDLFLGTVENKKQLQDRYWMPIRARMRKNTERNKERSGRWALDSCRGAAHMADNLPWISMRAERSWEYEELWSSSLLWSWGGNSAAGLGTRRWFGLLGGRFWVRAKPSDQNRCWSNQEHVVMLNSKDFHLKQTQHSSQEKISFNVQTSLFQHLQINPVRRSSGSGLRGSVENTREDPASWRLAAGFTGRRFWFSLCISGFGWEVNMS